MITNRIKNLDIKNRDLFTAMYGNTDDIFISSDLKRYDFYQQLFLYLKLEGYDIVVFFDIDDLFHSYLQKDLVRFQRLDRKKNSGNEVKSRYVANINSPLRGALRRSSDEKTTNMVADQSENAYQSILHEDHGEDSFYKLKETPETFRYLKNIFRDKQVKTALIIKAPTVASFNNQDQFENLFVDLQKKYAKGGLEHKIIISYDGKTSSAFVKQFDVKVTEGRMFFSSFFMEIFTERSEDNDQVTIPTKESYFVEIPDEKEIENFLHYQRLLGKNTFRFDYLDRIVGNLYRGTPNVNWTGKLLNKIKQEDINKYQGDGTKTALVRLDELIGMGNVKQEIHKFVKHSKFLSRNKRKNTVSKHMVLTGNPGTGKTIVARLIAEIFKEEGILRRGQFVETDSSGLLGQYIGETAVKTHDICQRALGGILFIDEAYKISDGTNDGSNNTFGEEAVTALLKVMEDKRDDIVIIIAGYENKMNNFFKTNPGLSSRFSNRIHFDDYSAQELVDIFIYLTKEHDYDLEPEFFSIVKKITTHLHKHKKKDFGNAREIRTLLEKVELNNAVRCSNQEMNSDLLRREDIPAEYLSLIIEGNSQGLEDLLINNVFSQQDNVSLIARPLKVWQKMKHKSAPLNYFFAGTSGVGKTYTAELMAQNLKTMGYEYLYLPMTEYQQETAITKLIGSDRGYIGSNEEPVIFERQRKNNKLIIVFDEIEKAHPKILVLLMQLLEKGTFAWNGDERDFKECIIVFTSNIAMEKIVALKTRYLTENKEIDNSDFQNEVRDILQNNGIRPEICGRIKNYIVFNKLDKNAIFKIVRSEIIKLAKKFNVKIENIDDVIIHDLGNRAAGSTYGARPITDDVERSLGHLLADLDTNEDYVKIDVLKLNNKITLQII